DVYERLVIARGKVSALDSNLIQLKEGKSGSEEHTVPIENINCLKTEIIKLLQNKKLSLDEVEKAFGKVDDGESVYKIIKSFEKVVSETCKKLGKKVKMGVDGNDLLVDPTVAKCLRESLIHLVRNSVDHGIEKPDDRVNFGKNEVGSLKISFRNGSGQLVLDVKDDGGGIDGERLFGKALASGVVEDSEMTDEEKLDLLFLSSVSTKEEVSDVSGRGVGMDAVRSGLGALGGKITVKSKLREGTTFTITIPNK
ncbi:ATP-binding protein, partial [Bacteriovoracales bacterium]|nr:ATP-binding protein [Bacteriovoracales bacterium]